VLLTCKYPPNQLHHKALTYVEYRAVSGVFQNIDPPTQRVCPPPAPKAGVGGGTHSPGGEGSIFWDARHIIVKVLLTVSSTINNRVIVAN
jgi:hypothetical protein